MAIAVRGTPQTGAATNGGDVTLTFSTGAGAPLENDVVVVFGGHGVTVTTLAAPGSGYTQLGIHTGSAPIFGAWYKVMGVTPDLSVVCSGGGNGSDGVAYCCWVFSGVAPTILDQTTATAGPTTSTNPDCASLTTQTANAWVLAMAGSAVNDAAITGPSGYSNHITDNGNDAADLTAAGATLAVVSPAATDPPSWTNWASGAWYAITVALKAEVVVITGTGALSAQAATAAGSGTSSSTGTGALSSQAADVTGAGYAAWVGTGALSSQSATAAGVGISSSTGTGAPAAQAATVAGSGISSSTGTGVLAAQASSVVGAGISSSTGTGTLTAQASSVAGLGVSLSTGTGALLASSATVIGSGTSASVGTGALTSGSATIIGVGTAGGGGSTVTFFTGVSVADGVTHFKGISRPTVTLEDAGGGTYTVTKTHELSGEFNPDSLSRETYLIDGELP